MKDSRVSRLEASWLGDFHGTLAYLIGYVGSRYSIRGDSHSVSNIAGLHMYHRNINHCLKLLIAFVGVNQ